MLDDKSLIAIRFRRFADRFDEQAEKEPPVVDPGALEDSKLLDEAGSLVITAFNRGYFHDISGLAKLVEEVANPPTYPEGRQT